MRTSRVVMVVALSFLFSAFERTSHAAPRAPTQLRFDVSGGNHVAAFYYPGDPTRPLVLMLHGASDTHTVFDFAPGFRTAAALASRGYPVVTLDRVGYGLSSRPNGDTLDFATSARYVHEVIQQLRAGALGFTPTAVVLLGPSVGADITMVEAGTYHDVDAVIVAFNTAQLQPELFEVDVGAWFAQGDYFDFGVEFRTRFFYTEPWAQRRLIDRDNATRSLVPRGEIASALANASAPYRAQITVPVLLLQAEHDRLFVPQDDSALFSSSPEVTYELLKNTGHKGFTHPTSHGVVVTVIARWLDETF